MQEVTIQNLIFMQYSETLIPIVRIKRFFKKKVGIWNLLELDSSAFKKNKLKFITQNCMI